jgi:hypothetical protein
MDESIERMRQDLAFAAYSDETQKKYLCCRSPFLVIPRSLHLG